MNDNEPTFHTLIEAAHDPLAALSLRLAAQGYNAQMISRLYIQTGFAIIHEHYGLEDVKKVCAHELNMFYKTWKHLN